MTCAASEALSSNENDSWLLQLPLLRHTTRQNQFVVNAKTDVEKMHMRALQCREEALGPDQFINT